MAISQDFIDYTLDQLSSWGGVSARKMFGGAGLFRNGKIFALLANDIVYLKVDDSNRDRFLEIGSEPFKPFPHKPGTMSYYELPTEIVEDHEDFIEWSAQALAIHFKVK